jgi:hypothetical protein
MVEERATLTNLLFLSETRDREGVGMSREICSMMTWFQGEYFCDFYDFGCLKCSEVKRYPDGLDEEDGDIEDYDDQEYFPV